MHFTRPLVAGFALATATTAASAQEGGLAETVRLLQRVATQYAVLMTRMFVDLTYDSIASSPAPTT